MDQGRVVEFDHPHTLLQREGGYFHQMVQQAGPQAEHRLHSLAKAAYYDKMAGKDITQYHCMDGIGDQKIQEENDILHQNGTTNMAYSGDNEDLSYNVRL